MDRMFTPRIADWASWSKVYQDISAWKNLIAFIYKQNALPFSEITPLVPGTNAVFRVGETVVKLFAPKESGMDALSDYATELGGLRHANAAGIAAPKLLANGRIDDRYRFFYLVTEYMHGAAFGEAEKSFTDGDKKQFGKSLRILTRRMNIPCPRINSVDVIRRAKQEKSWEAFPESFLQERREWLNGCAPGAPVFIHGDLNPDNVLIAPGRGPHIYVIDFADSVHAPQEYELPAIVCALFGFEKQYLKGFFGENFDPGKLTEPLLRGLLMHDFGAGMIRYNLGEIATLSSLGVLRKRIAEKLNR